MSQILVGVLVTTAWTLALFFLRFWRQTKDRFFALFSLSFLLLGANWLSLAFMPIDAEARTYLYLLRFAAFVLILVAIYDKNRAHAPRPSPTAVDASQG